MVTYESKDAPASERRRVELGKFLRTRRARLKPEDFGMPAGSRRKTPGLRREGLAMLAGVGVTWHTWLEQGREINASTQVLDALARTLHLDRAERWHMYVLAEAVPVVVSNGRCSAPEAISEIVRSLDPLPAVVTNARFDIIEENTAYRDLFRDLHLLPCTHRNSLWCTLTEPRTREMFPAGPLTFTTSELQVPAPTEARLVVYTPADDETRKRLPLTRVPAR